jgi:hypothetical protein
MQSIRLVNRPLLGVAAAALFVAGWACVAGAQAVNGSMTVRVTVLESINPIAVIRPADALRVVTDARGSHGQVRFGIESDMPVDVSIRAVDGSPLADAATLASRIRLVGSAPVARGARAVQARALSAGSSEIGLDFNWSDFGDASRGTLELPATEVRATAWKGDAEVTVVAYLPAVSLRVPRQPAAGSAGID